MPTIQVTQYQIKTEPPAQSVQPGQTNAAPWLYPWSEPVRPKPGLGARFQQFTSLGTPNIPGTATFLQGWYVPFSEPVRLKRGIPSIEQHYFEFEPEPPEFLDIPWYGRLSEPVRFKPGLRAHLQQALAQPPRILPTPNVTATMAATETDTDVFLGAINVYSGGSANIPGQGANVSLEEVQIPNDPVSIKGN